MAQPFKHPRAGMYWFRRVVPERYRAIVGQREWKRSLHTKDPAEAKRRYVAEARQYEEALAAARRGVRVGEAALSAHEVLALGAKWLSDKLAVDGRLDPNAINGALGWEEELSRMEAMADSEREWTAYVAKDVAALLKQEQLRVEIGSELYRQIARTIFNRKADFAAVMATRYDAAENGDPLPALQAEARALGAAPKWKRPVDRTKTIEWALDAWITERRPAIKTAYEWRKILAAFGLQKKLHDVTAADVIAFKDRWVRGGQKPNTVDKKLSALRTVFRWALKNKHVEVDPTAGVVVTGLKQDRERKKRTSYTKEEARKLLLAARTASETHRWLTWLLAATGCRIQEAAQAFAHDIRQEGRVWFLNVTDEGEGQHLKTPKARRRIPIHPELKREGFFDYVRNLPRGSRLFPEITPDKLGNWGGNVDKTLNRWAQ